MAGQFMQPKWRLAGAQLNCRTMDGLCHEKRHENHENAQT